MPETIGSKIVSVILEAIQLNLFCQTKTLGRSSWMLNTGISTRRRGCRIPTCIVRTIIYGRHFSQFQQSHIRTLVNCPAISRDHRHLFRSPHWRFATRTIVIEEGNNLAGYFFVIRILQGKVFIQAMRSRQ